MRLNKSRKTSKRRAGFEQNLRLQKHKYLVVENIKKFGFWDK
jgi:hypothetical protein